MDPGPPRHVPKLRLQWSWLPKENDLRSHEGARILRKCCQEVQERIPVSSHFTILPISTVYSTCKLYEIMLTCFRHNLITILITNYRYAKYLELMNLPDEMRELLDEYLDANSRADANKDCAEFFQCPFSIHDTMKRSEPTNSILN